MLALCLQSYDDGLYLQSYDGLHLESYDDGVYLQSYDDDLYL